MLWIVIFMIFFIQRSLKSWNYNHFLQDCCPHDHHPPVACSLKCVFHCLLPKVSEELGLGALAHKAAEQAEEFVMKVPALRLLRSSLCFLTKPICPIVGVGGVLERVPLPASAQLAAGQRLPAHGPPTSAAHLLSLLQVYFQNSHRNWKHLDAFAWYRLVFTLDFKKISFCNVPC